jgi:aerobic-type carbon monoxide dehydrogenase small subunit (CoxS/CutS family)
MSGEADLTVTVNATRWAGAVPVRQTLADFLRERLQLTGTHVGCEQGVCGACTVLVNGAAVRSCLMLAVQAEGADVTTVEGLSGPGRPSPLQEAFVRHRAFQCGFCTPGFLAAAEEIVRSGQWYTRDELRELLNGHICRCTGYQPIIEAVYECLG